MQKLSAYVLKSVETRATVNVVQPVEEMSGKKTYLSRIQMDQANWESINLIPEKKIKQNISFSGLNAVNILFQSWFRIPKKNLGLSTML